MAEAKNGSPDAKPQKRQRLAVRAGMLLVQHAHVVSACCYFAGLVALLLLPVLAKNTYISENALMPGSAEPKFDRPNALDAFSLAEEVKSLAAKNTDASMAIQEWLVSNFEALGAESYLHPFMPSRNPFDEVRFFSTSPVNATRGYQWRVDRDAGEASETTAINVAGIIRAPRGEGHDAIVMVTPFDIQNFEMSDALALGLGMEVFGLLSTAVWLAKDIIWLVADSRYGSYAAVSAWLKDYYEPQLMSPSVNNFVVSADGSEDEKSTVVKASCGVGLSSVKGSRSDQKSLDDLLLHDFKRAGNIAVGFVMELRQGHDDGPDGVDYLEVKGEGLNGQMPNLDLVNVCINIATGWRQGLRVVLRSSPEVANSALVRGVGYLAEIISRKLSIFNSKWGHNWASDYSNELATLVTSMLNQASGVPTGAHGALRDYQVDAVTLRLSLGGKTANKKTRVDVLEKLGRLLELVIRSVNNLLEKLHHSLFLYVMTSANKFVAVSVYMIPVFLLLVSFPLEAASQLSSTDAASDHSSGVLTTVQIEGVKDELAQKVVKGNRLSSRGQDSVLHGQSVQPLLIAIIIHLWSALVAVLPPLVHSIATPVRSLVPYQKFSDEELKITIWATLAGLSLSVFLQLISLASRKRSKAARQDKCWRFLKGYMLGFATIGLVVMSVLNYAVAVVGAVTLVPMCLSSSPLSRTWRKMKTRGSHWRSIVILISRNLITVLASPFGLAVVSKALYPADVNIEVLWRITEFLWSWGSGLYLYALLLYLPCTILSLYILFIPGY